MNDALFEIPSHLNAQAPIELTGKKRDEVRLMVLNRRSGACRHNRFDELPSQLKKGDVLVVNNSRTIPASLQGKQGNRKLEVRLSRMVNPHEWDALVIGSMFDAHTPISFGDGVIASMSGKGSEVPLVRLAFNVEGPRFFDFLFQNGQPIRYEYIEEPWPLEFYQNVYGSVPGSVEMASAGRAFTWELISRLRREGVVVVSLQLHAGLSYYGNDIWPNPVNHPEAYHLPQETADAILKAKKEGNRVIAVGTTVVRTLETVAANHQGEIVADAGVTNTYITKDTPLRVVDGLITGLHEPEASHLDLLRAFVRDEHLFGAYRHAMRMGYLWHEFGDMNLIL
ncbi:S-adenosylmethionine:tRNA ribosyltransferase-isomerase [Rossellomorea aquimaris]|uniref:S-adenosylmethionine:tRNA ribosyltransferase-isomerase n=1 Tax=Rossellomorea aquimaris TaxID=189382 RepID=UPI001CD247DA|nr:S-adenosylmethionine:tRNA ribosyltransferase-isomerase [Rossellomorea aquimaris]MCA1055016.1 S-adenosylmethionine:tRNA ribosyltransferase-isomerase [Rossellomorea aquimaris]